MRWIIRIVAFFAALVVLGLGALVAVPTERVAALVADRLSAATGREVVMAGELRPTLFPSLGVRVGEVSIGNPDWVDAGPLITAERLDVSVEWAPLLRGEVRLDRAEFIAPRITLVRAADGRVSWDFTGTAGTETADPSSAAATPRTDVGGARVPFLVGFDRAAITGGEVRWIDEGAGQAVTVTNLDAILSLPSASGPATLAASGDVAGQRLAADVAIDGVAPLLSGQVRTVAASLSWSGGEAGFDGRLSLAPALDGTFSLDATDLGPLLGLAGATMPDLPRGAGRDGIAAGGQVTLTDAGTLHLRDGVLSLDDNDLQVALDMVPGAERPMIRGTVAGGVLTLGTAGGTGQGAGTGAEPGGWPTDPIDVAGLFAADAELALRFGGLQLDAAQLGAVEVNATLDAGRLVFQIGRLEAYGGRLAGQFVVNGRNGLSVGGDLILTEVRLAPLLEQFAGYDRLEGTGSASLRFLGVGNDVATIMSGLEGEGDFAFGAGAILGFDLAGMIRNFDTSFRGEGARTVYDSIAANFTIRDGVLSNDDLALEAPWGGVEGAGRVDLGARTLDYRVIPGVMRDEDGQAGIAVPVLISGPWSGPSIRPDLEYLAEQQFLEQRDRLAAEAEARLAAEQDRIEAEVRDRANELLGTEIGAGDGRDEIEGALQDRLSEETQNVLSRLLGGAPDDEQVEVSE